MKRFGGQVVLLTGGARCLGLAMAQRFAAEGGAVALADIDERALAEAVVAVRGEGAAQVAGERVDVSSAGEVDRWIGGVVRRFGRIDVLVNNAGVIRDNRVERISDDDWRTVVDVNLTAAFWRGNFGQANYAAAKAGVVGLTSTVALETARHGITANAIAPGLIETPMLASMDAGAREKLVSRVPMGHTGDPADIAAAACFLAVGSAAR